MTSYEIKAEMNLQNLIKESREVAQALSERKWGRRMTDEELKEEFEREIEIANKDIDLMPEQEDYMRWYLGGILCAYRIVFGKNYEEKTDDKRRCD